MGRHESLYSLVCLCTVEGWMFGLFCVMQGEWDTHSVQFTFVSSEILYSERVLLQLYRSSRIVVTFVPRCTVYRSMTHLVNLMYQLDSVCRWWWYALFSWQKEIYPFCPRSSSVPLKSDLGFIKSAEKNGRKTCYLLISILSPTTREWMTQSYKLYICPV